MYPQPTSPLVQDLYKPLAIHKPFKKMPDINIQIQGTMPVNRVLFPMPVKLDKAKKNQSIRDFGSRHHGSPAHHEDEYSPIQYLLLTIFTVAAILFMFRAFLILR